MYRLVNTPFIVPQLRDFISDSCRWSSIIYNILTKESLAKLLSPSKPVRTQILLASWWFVDFYIRNLCCFRTHILYSANRFMPSITRDYPWDEIRQKLGRESVLAAPTALRANSFRKRSCGGKPGWRVRRSGPRTPRGRAGRRVRTRCRVRPRSASRRRRGRRLAARAGR